MASELTARADLSALLPQYDSAGEQEQTVKRCTKCGIEKDKSLFVKNKNKKDGLHCWCKECARGSAQRWRSDPQTREKNNRKHAALRQSQEYKARERERDREYKRLCRQNPAYREMQRQYHLRRRQDSDYRMSLLIDNQSYRYTRRGISPAEMGSFTLEEWNDLCANHDHRCACCGQAKPLEIDHIVPLSRGGRNDIGNIQPLCKSCNKQKFLRTIDYRNAKAGDDENTYGQS